MVVVVVQLHFDCADHFRNCFFFFCMFAVLKPQCGGGERCRVPRATKLLKLKQHNPKVSHPNAISTEFESKALVRFVSDCRFSFCQEQGL